jgi:regulator of cell morphogenesis and NO signaling
MQLNVTKTVREIAIEVPGATRVLEKYGIDYCCGGAKPIGDACLAAGVTVEEITQSLERAEEASQEMAESTDWRKESLAALITYIVDKHHKFTREELARIEPLLAKVCAVHGERRPELFQIQAWFEELKRELLPHMMKEENVLFPYIRHLEQAVTLGLSIATPPFGTVQNPVHMMMAEHDAAGELLSRIRKLSGDFNLPPDACATYTVLYEALQELEKDLHQHIHLENNILFPSAIRME